MKLGNWCDEAARSLVKEGGQAQRFSPAVILIDIGLPDMNGFEVARRIKEQNHRALLIAATGFSDADTERRAKEAGFADRLVKPIDLDQLHALITQHVAARTRSGS